MCGDTHCPSCGPAQGNWKCILCGSWADDCCEHILESGNYKPEFIPQVEAEVERERLAAEAEAKYWEDYPDGSYEE